MRDSSFYLFAFYLVISHFFYGTLGLVYLCMIRAR